MLNPQNAAVFGLVCLSPAAGFSTFAPSPSFQIGGALHAFPALIRSGNTSNSLKRQTKLMSTIGPVAEEASNDADRPIFEPFGVGVKRDFSRRFPHYLSDITDGLNAQSLGNHAISLFRLSRPCHWVWWNIECRYER